MTLYPRLPTPVAQGFALDYAQQELSEIERQAALGHESAVYAPVGGTRATDQLLKQIRDAILRVAASSGYPRKPSRDQARSFDREVSVLLHKKMDLSPHEASHGGIWQFVCCVMVPEVVRWRFPGGAQGTPPQRFLGGVRNALGRLWWRAQVLKDERNADPYHALKKMGEDEIVQIMERPTMAGCSVLVRATVDSFLQTITAQQTIAGKRMALMRECQKRLMRFFPLVALDLMQLQRIEALVRAQTLEATAAVRQERADTETVYLV